VLSTTPSPSCPYPNLPIQLFLLREYRAKRLAACERILLV
jgi:hypothetical protein